jgi:glycosyltransferase involved in cell wall biosynthesis
MANRSLASLLVRRRPTAPRATSLPAPRGARGVALLAYIRSAVAVSDEDAAALTGHSNTWESREIARALHDLGYGVDAIDWHDDEFEPAHAYDVLLAIDGRLNRLADEVKAPRLLLHLTGSHPAFQNASEQRRIDELRERRGISCVPRRTVEDVPAFERALERATACSLLGNAFTLSTFPAQLHAKITLLPVSASRLVRTKSRSELAPAAREFLWFFGSGAVHKGLDRALEAFARNPRLTLNVVGNIAAETDFVDAYRRELTELENIRWHGFIDPAAPAFDEIASRCVAFVAPSCSESVSTAAATLLQLGLYPIVSRETGMTLPTGAGLLLETSSVEEIEAAATQVFELPADELAAQIERTQALALATYSRERFADEVRRYLRGALA